MTAPVDGKDAALAIGWSGDIRIAADRAADQPAPPPRRIGHPDRPPARAASGVADRYQGRVGPGQLLVQGRRDEQRETRRRGGEVEHGSMFVHDFDRLNLRGNRIGPAQMLVVFDEVQKAPSLLPAVKKAVRLSTLKIKP